MLLRFRKLTKSGDFNLKQSPYPRQSRSRPVLKFQQNPAAHGTIILQAWHEADGLQLLLRVSLQSTGRIAIDHLNIDNAACQVNPDTNTDTARLA